MSSGGGWQKFDPRDYAQKLREAEQNNRDVEFDTEVSRVIASELVNYNNRDIEAINAHLDEIKRALEKEIDGTIDLRFGGSVSKHTYVDGMSDVDALVLLNKSELQQSQPKEVLKYFFHMLIDRFPKTDIVLGDLAVTVSFSDVEIQLIPALRFPTGFRIPTRHANYWSRIDPEVFSKKLTQANSNTSNKLIPVIKLIKSINSGLPQQYQLKSYHIESLAEKIFSGYNNKTIPKDMLKYFFQHASQEVKRPIKDVSGQSIYVDEYLKDKNSVERSVVSNALNRIYRQMENADGARSVDKWKEILGLPN